MKMARIKLLTRDEMNPKQQEQYDLFPSNLVSGLLATETITGGYAALGKALRFTKLSPRIKEFVILRVAYLSNSQYELMQHKDLAALQGWTTGDMEAVAANDISHFDDEMSGILEFVNQCVEQVKVTDSTFQEVKKYLDDAEIAELVILIGHYMMTARFLETLEIDLDDQPTSWDNVKMEENR